MHNQSLGSNSGSRVGFRARNQNLEVCLETTRRIGVLGLGSNSRGRIWGLIRDTGMYSPISD